MISVMTLIEDVLDREGGYVNHPNDRGGPTNYGITQRTLSKYEGREVSLEEVRHMTRELAMEIYKQNYYKAPRIDMLPPDMQAQVFDIAVNSGPRRAVKMLQSVLVWMGYRLVVDGIIGGQTAQAATLAERLVGNWTLNNLLAQKRIQFYETLVREDNTQSVFLQGWKNRANEFRVTVPV